MPHSVSLIQDTNDTDVQHPFLINLGPLGSASEEIEPMLLLEEAIVEKSLLGQHAPECAFSDSVVSIETLFRADVQMLIGIRSQTDRLEVEKSDAFENDIYTSLDDDFYYGTLMLLEKKCRNNSTSTTLRWCFTGVTNDDDPTQFVEFFVHDIVSIGRPRDNIMIEMNVYLPDATFPDAPYGQFTFLLPGDPMAYHKPEFAYFVSPCSGAIHFQSTLETLMRPFTHRPTRIKSGSAYNLFKHVDVARVLPEQPTVHYTVTEFGQLSIG
jgi:hypothetical protein